MATNPYATQAFMNPYLQASLAPQLAEAQRQYGITGAQEQAQATAANAFGGTREALMAAENERNKNLAMNQIIGQGYNNAFQAAQQAQQFGANLGLQGQQAALQGMGQAGQAGATLGQLGGQQLAAQQGIIGTQATQGAQQQAQQQQMINQAIQNYATAQQYPLMELGTLSNMLRGLPMQAATTQNYQAVANPLVSGIGMAGTLASLGNYAGAGGTKTGASGGIMEADKYYVGGELKAKYDEMDYDELKALDQTATGEKKKLINDVLATKAPKMASGGIVAFKDGDKVTADDKATADYEAWQSQANPAVTTGLEAIFPPSLLVTDNPIKAGIKDVLRYPFKGTIGGVDDSGKPVTREEKYGIHPYLDEYNARRNADIADKNAAARDIAQQLENQKAVERQKAALIGAPVAQDVKVTPQDVGSNMTPFSYNYNDPTKALVDATGQSVANIAPPQNLSAPNQTQATQATNKAIYQNPIDYLTKVNQMGEEARKAEEARYLKEVKDAPMSEEGQKYYNTVKDKIDNAKTKDEQLMWMHSAMFFAKLGTTPGPLSYAMLSAVKDQLPLYVKDKNDLEKYNDQLNKSLYEISNAQLLKRQGEFKLAQEAETNAKKNAIETIKTGIEEQHYKHADEAALIHANAAMKVAESGQGIKEGRLDLQQQAAIDKDIKDNWGDSTSMNAIQLSNLQNKKTMGTIKPEEEKKLNALLTAKEKIVKDAYTRFAPNVPYTPSVNIAPTPTTDYSKWGQVKVGS